MENMLSDVTSMGSEELLAHTAWMNRLATRLVLGADRVDDLVQETWKAALVNPPSKHVPMRAWLAGIMRKRALESRRSEGRRTGHAARIAEEASNEVPSAAELNTRLEQQRLLLAQVNQLPAKYREVLLLRFFEDMQPSAIALHMDLPVSTVKTHLQRALGQMRERLDKDHNGDRQAWSLALLPLSTLDRTSAGLVSTLVSTPIGVMIMTHLIKTSILAASILLSAFGMWQLTAQPGSNQTQQPVLVPVAGTPIAPETPTTSATAARQDPVRRAVRVASKIIRGQVVDVDGVPVPGAQILQVRAPDPAGNDSPNWSNRRLTYADTTASFNFAHADLEEGEGSTGQPWLAASHPDYVSMEPLQIHDGAITLSLTPILSTTVEVEVIDKTSGVAIPRFHVFASLDKQPYSHSRKLRNTSVEVFTGQSALATTFPKGQPLRIEVAVLGLPGDPTLSQSRSSHLQVKPSRLIEPVPGGITKVQFILDLDQPERAPEASLAFGRIVDNESGLPIAGAEIRVNPISKQSHGSQNHYVMQFRQVLSRTDGNFRIALTAGGPEAMIWAYHPLYQQPLPSSRSLPNSATFDGRNPVVIRLKRRAILRGQVIDSMGAPMPMVPLLCISDEEYGGRTMTFELRTTQRWRLFSDDQGRFEIPGLEASRYHVFVLPTPRAPDEMALANASYELAAGEVREVTLQVGDPDRIVITGQVAAPYPLDYALAPIFLPYNGDGSMVQARPSGSGFEAVDLAMGDYLVLLAPAIDDHKGPFALVRDVSIEPGTMRTINLDFPSGSLTGRVDSEKRSGALKIVAVPTVPTGYAHDFLMSSKLLRLFSSPVAADGSYTLEHLESGSYELILFPDSSNAVVEIIAQQPITINGHTRLEAWRIE